MWTRIIQSVPLHIVLVIVAVGASVSAGVMVRQALTISEESAGAEARIDALTHKKEELRSRISELETEGVVRREAKARLNLKNSGEHVVVVVPEKIVTASVHASGILEKSAMVWQWIKVFIGNAIGALLARLRAHP